VAAAAVAADAGVITVRGVSKWFSTAEGTPLQVLDNINLTIAAQAIVAIIGASGCGKSTLLNIISGLVTPERGDIILNGIPARNSATGAASATCSRKTACCRGVPRCATSSSVWKPAACCVRSREARAAKR